MYELQVPVDGLQHRINEDGLFGLLVCEQVGVCAALLLKQLHKKKHRLAHRNDSLCNQQ